MLDVNAQLLSLTQTVGGVALSLAIVLAGCDSAPRNTRNSGRDSGRDSETAIAPGSPSAPDPAIAQQPSTNAEATYDAPAADAADPQAPTQTAQTTPDATQPSVEPPVERTETAATSGESVPVAPVFRDVLAEVAPQTELPVLLPSQLSVPEDPPIYATAEASADRYAIELAFSPTCRGATACFYGQFAAKRTDGDYYGVGESFAETVELANGVTGEFNPMTCGASCAPPVLEWSLDGVRYRMELKGVGGDDAEALAQMAALANSAIAAGGRSPN